MPGAMTPKYAHFLLPHTASYPECTLCGPATPGQQGVTGVPLKTHRRCGIPKSHEPFHLTGPPGKRCSPHSFSLFPPGIPPIQPERRGKCCPDLPPACSLGRTELSREVGELLWPGRTRLALWRTGAAWFGRMLGSLVVSLERRSVHTWGVAAGIWKIRG